MGKAENQHISLKSGEYLVSDDRNGSVRVTFSEGGHAMVGTSEISYELIDGNPAQGEFKLLYQNKVYHVLVDPAFEPEEDTKIMFTLNGCTWKGNVDDKRSLLKKRFGGSSASSGGEIRIKAPMPGLVTKIHVKDGDEVKAGQGLVVLEAMKMENELKSDQNGKILRIDCEEGKAVEKGESLLIVHYDHA
jgi:pyruvate carboxylase subunit B